MKMIIALLLVFSFLPCEAKYKVTWTEDRMKAITLDTTGNEFPFETVKMEKVFATPLDAQQFKNKLPIYAMDIKYEVVKDDEAIKGDLHKHLIDFADTTGN